jgi:RNA polymerase sigma-70 factor (ECF subfamily)
VKLICLRQFNGLVEEAEDACSVVLEKAHLSLPGKLSQIRNLDAWIYRMTINVCIDIKRGKTRRLRLMGSGAAEANRPGRRPAVCSALDPESQLLGKELRTLILKSIDRLPSRLVSAARLYFVEDLTYDDLSEKLSITNANARKRIQEARKHLRISLAKHRLGARYGRK